ncbi:MULTISPECIES: hypothetical protein [Methylorubrum]|uniref:Uncharacterized protein n=2 Tax=Methylorubrum TaxID=2282523 RepID=A0ABQ4UKN3_9HYPH|nr:MULTISPECIES: hypothetical protein [Methylobacteriaceae]MCG5249440.1 hypothetical protein [Methylorubrum extorquens]GJE67825.1 hypothetical protein LNAOJCKE_5058 [Methylorubrum aminovorans]GJE78560.1 hypothetical protein BGCPKDLD_5177 [Methylorubrum suomiense]GMA80343.1 hypothetical protein GCM10025880_67600 [Methylorubrum aminovorans]GMA80393.1 hypothetical protein GCM10025880_68100 [Methylorubrum aminovorans]
MSSATVTSLPRPPKPDLAPEAAAAPEPGKRLPKPLPSKGKPPAETNAEPVLRRAAATASVQMPFQVPAEVRRQFKAYAAERDMTNSELFLRIWEEYRANHS